MKMMFTATTFVLGVSTVYAQYMPQENPYPYLPLVYTMFIFGFLFVMCLSTFRFLYNFIVVLKESKNRGEDFEQAKRAMRHSLAVFIFFALLCGSLWLYNYFR